MGTKSKKIDVQGSLVAVMPLDDSDYISLTDIARHKNSGRSDDLIRNWLRNRNTLEFIGIWEQLNNPNFKPVEFDGFRKQSGLNSFTLTPKQWIEATSAIGIISRAGRYGGTDAIKENLIPPELTKQQVSFVYAAEADVLNMALFGMTAKQWRENHPDEKGNIRDFANVSQLVCLSNLENLNALFIQETISQPERLEKLNQIAIQQMRLLTDEVNVLEQRFETSTGETHEKHT